MYLYRDVNAGLSRSDFLNAGDFDCKCGVWFFRMGRWSPSSVWGGRQMVSMNLKPRMASPNMLSSWRISFTSSTSWPCDLYWSSRWVVYDFDG